MHYFRNSLIVTAVGLLLALYVGGASALYIVALLAVLEISLSFDNAVVNVKVLETMEVKWQKRFITFGIPIAIFGMRFLFPIIIVAIASGLGIFETFNLALNDPHTYHAQLIDVEALIFAFGGSFLLMVFLNFLFDDEREEKWIKSIENSQLVMKMSQISKIQMLLVLGLGIILFLATLFSSKLSYDVTVAYLMGVVLYSLIASLDDLFNVNGVRSGIIGFLYLEMLDASFSFDGVIGAFSLSSNIFIIMIGLGIGAMFVRSLTLYMLEKKTLTEYRYLEHGAHYAVLALALIMLIQIFFHIDEMIVGTVGISFIAVSIYHSIQANRHSVVIKAIN
jgi:hypothetical protein